jgi:hypothetical protein
MGDYGFRISQDGKDVKTCEDRECVLTSKYSLAKGGLYGVGNITDTGDPAEGTLVITHNLGFIPVARIFMLVEGEYIEIPETEWQAGVYIFDVYYEHTSVNAITIYASLWVDGDTPTIDLDFAYYISNEKVNI